MQAVSLLCMQAISHVRSVNGKFTQPQREIYELVLKAQKRAIELLVPGNSIKLANDEVIRIKLKVWLI